MQQPMLYPYPPYYLSYGSGPYPPPPLPPGAAGAALLAGGGGWSRAGGSPVFVQPGMGGAAPHASELELASMGVQ